MKKRKYTFSLNYTVFFHDFDIWHFNEILQIWIFNTQLTDSEMKMNSIIIYIWKPNHFIKEQINFVDNASFWKPHWSINWTSENFLSCYMCYNNICNVIYVFTVFVNLDNSSSCYLCINLVKLNHIEYLWYANETCLITKPEYTFYCLTKLIQYYNMYFEYSTSKHYTCTIN